jgi:hypothetical protein
MLIIHLELHGFVMKVPSFSASFQWVLAVAATTLSFVAILAWILAIFLTVGTAAAKLCTLLTGTTFFLRGVFFLRHLSLAGWL